MSAQKKTKKKKDSDNGSAWMVWALVGAVTLVVCILVVVVVGSGGSDETPNSTDGPIDAEALYGVHCANCHAIDGSGAIGPQVNDGRVVRRYPDIDDQIAVITDGVPNTPAMPPFDDVLSDAEIRAVAEYERSL